MHHTQIFLNNKTQPITAPMYYCRKSANFERFNTLVKFVSADKMRFT
jgi:hypothetical protein